MSSGTSYNWAYEQERERQRQAELRAELERLRVRQRQLRRLQVALATQGIRTASAEVAEVDAQAGSAQLSVAVTEARTSLDALESRLEEAVAQRTRERRTRWVATPVAAAELPPEPSLGTALAEERARTEAAVVATLARAAEELVATEATRCADDQLADLQRLAGSVGGLDPVRARRALIDIESRVASSIRRRRDSDRAEQIRIELLTLAGELPTEQRTALRRRIDGTPDTELAGLRDEVRAVVDRHHHRQARTEVTARVLAALREQGYELGEPFDDLLTDGPRVTVLTSVETPDYGVRLLLDPEHDRFQATTVRREGTSDTSRDQEVQQYLCKALDEIEADLATGGLSLHRVLRRPVQDRVATMPAHHWPATATSTSTTEVQQAEYERQRQAGRRAKGRTS